MHGSADEAIDAIRNAQSAEERKRKATDGGQATPAIPPLPAEEDEDLASDSKGSRRRIMGGAGY